MHMTLHLDNPESPPVTKPFYVVRDMQFTTEGIKVNIRGYIESMDPINTEKHTLYGVLWEGPERITSVMFHDIEKHPEATLRTVEFTWSMKFSEAYRE